MCLRKAQEKGESAQKSGEHMMAGKGFDHLHRDGMNDLSVNL